MNLSKALAGVGGMTTVSRVLGFLRDSIIARIFGAGMVTDAFFVAFKIPNLLRRISAEGAFTQAFVPILAEYKSSRSPKETAILINKVATLLGLFLIIVTLLGIFGAPWLIYISAPGFASDPEKFNLTVDMLQITFPYIFFVSLVSMAGGILNSYGKFIVPAFTPVWLNISFIASALFFADFFSQPVMVLAWAVFIGGILQLLFQIPFLKQIGFLPKLDFKINDPGVWRITKLMGPAILGVSVTQISLLINTIFASFLAVGSVSWLYYADRLMEFPVGVLGVALGTILLPSLSGSISKNNSKEYSSLVNWGLRLSILLSAPAALGLYILAAPLIATLFYYGAFSEHDVLMTQYALTAYSIGLIALVLIKVLAPAFYAQKNIKTPVKIAIFTLFCTQLMNMIFIGFIGHAGLALAIAIGACINAGLLFYHLKKNKIFVLEKGWILFFIKIILGLVAMTTLLLFLKGPDSNWLVYSAWEKVFRLGFLTLAGALSYFVALRILGVDLRTFTKRLSNQ